MTEDDSVIERANQPMDLEHPKRSYEYQAVLINEGKKILELDTDGLLTKFLKERGCNVTRLKINSMSHNNKKDYADKIIEENMESLDLVKDLGSEKYDVILMDDFLTRVPNTHKFLTQLREFLVKDGYMVFSIPNVSHGSVRISLLNGEFNCEAISSKEVPQRFFTLDTVLSMIEDSGYSIIQLCRVEKEIDTNTENYPYTIPGELIDAILRDSESKTIQYVLKISSTNQDLTVRKWLREFPKTATSERLKEFFQYYKENYGGVLLKTLQAKDAHIAEMESVIRQRDAHIAEMESIIKKSDDKKSNHT